MCLAVTADAIPSWRFMRITSHRRVDVTEPRRYGVRFSPALEPTAKDGAVRRYAGMGRRSMYRPRVGAPAPRACSRAPPCGRRFTSARATVLPGHHEGRSHVADFRKGADRAGDSLAPRGR